MTVVGKISLEDLNRRLADPGVGGEELARYFEVDRELSGPFNPVLAFNPETVDVPPTLEGRARGAALLNSANFLARLRRHVASIAASAALTMAPSWFPKATAGSSIPLNMST
ncbi:hypothetical protein [Ensifer sp. ENS07]|uniref:hypothetical protein n=1 Tax=Ensifer sp. ENS07 TaxID=2769274 RepID=UPI001FEF9CC9|nr:hypothetical protein [Ensifer sp. ENS07]